MNETDDMPLSKYIISLAPFIIIGIMLCILPILSITILSDSPNITSLSEFVDAGKIETETIVNDIPFVSYADIESGNYKNTTVKMEALIADIDNFSSKTKTTLLIWTTKNGKLVNSDSWHVKGKKNIHKEDLIYSGTCRIKEQSIGKELYNSLCRRLYNGGIEKSDICRFTFNVSDNSKDILYFSDITDVKIVGHNDTSDLPTTKATTTTETTTEITSNKTNIIIDNMQTRNVLK